MWCRIEPRVYPVHAKTLLMNSFVVQLEIQVCPVRHPLHGLVSGTQTHNYCFGEWEVPWCSE